MKCRKCDSNENLNNNPLIKICQCQDYIHYQCLKNIINNEDNISKYENSKVKRYKYKKFCCDECNIQYPLRFKILENIYELVDLTVDLKRILLF